MQTFSSPQIKLSFDSTSSNLGLKERKKQNRSCLKSISLAFVFSHLVNVLFLNWSQSVTRSISVTWFFFKVPSWTFIIFMMQQTVIRLIGALNSNNVLKLEPKRRSRFVSQTLHFQKEEWKKSRSKQAQMCRCANPVGAGAALFPSFPVSVRKFELLELLFFLILWFQFHIYWFVLPGVSFLICLRLLRSVWTWLRFVVRHVREWLKMVPWKTSN